MNEKKLSPRRVWLLWLCVIGYFSGCIIVLIHSRYDIIQYYALKKIDELKGNIIEETYPTFWEYFYYIWESFCFSLLFFTIINLIPKAYRWILKPAFYYSIIRTLWEISFPITEMDVNSPMVVNTLSLAIVTGLAILLLRDLVQRSKE